MTDILTFEQSLEAERNARVARDIAKHDDILRECFRRRLKHIADASEQAQDYCRELMRSGADVSDEIKELTEIGLGMQLVAGILQMQAAKILEAAE